MSGFSDIPADCAGTSSGDGGGERNASPERIFAGVDIGGTRIKIGLADDEGHLRSCNVLETRDCCDADNLLEIVANEIRAQARAVNTSIKAIGLGCPGRIDFTAGKVVWLKTKLEFLEGIPLAASLGDRLGCPVSCDNDVNTILAGEMRFGAGRNYRDVIAVTVGTGIGGAVAVGAQIVRGRNWATGHFGYMSLDPCGPRHVCGNTGIIEEHASQSGILCQVRRALAQGETSPLIESLARGEEPGLRELFEATQRGDSLAQRLADQLIRELGVLIANLIYALDPELVLVGGGLIVHSSAVLDAIQRAAFARIAYLPPGVPEILPMALGDAAGVLGGVALAIDTIAQTK